MIEKVVGMSIRPFLMRLPTFFIAVRRLNVARFMTCVTLLHVYMNGEHEQNKQVYHNILALFYNYFFNLFLSSLSDKQITHNNATAADKAVVVLRRTRYQVSE